MANPSDFDDPDQSFWKLKKGRKNALKLDALKKCKIVHIICIGFMYKMEWHGHLVHQNPVRRSFGYQTCRHSQHPFFSEEWSTSNTAADHLSNLKKAEKNCILIDALMMIDLQWSSAPAKCTFQQHVLEQVEKILVARQWHRLTPRVKSHLDLRRITLRFLSNFKVLTPNLELKLFT